MDYIFMDMNDDYAKEIAFEWKYSGVYSFYDMTADQEDLELFLDEKNWDKYFAVYSRNKWRKYAFTKMRKYL